MKRKLIIALLILSTLAAGVSFKVFHAMRDVTSKLENIIFIYKLQSKREKLAFQLRKIQKELVRWNTPAQSMNLDRIINDVDEMSSTMQSCFTCHHQASVQTQLKLLQADINIFMSSLSQVFTIRNNKTRYLEAAGLAYRQGDKLLTKMNETLLAASAKLEQRSSSAMIEVFDMMRVLTFLVFALPLAGLLAGLFFMRAITKPIESLMEATHKLSQGALDYRVTGLNDEFASLGNSFNAMAESLTNQMQVAQRAEQMTIVGQMAAGLAHEIKNPLAGIKVSMEVIKGESYIHDQDRQVLTMVIAVINRVNSLINDLLNFARPSTPKLRSISLNPLLEQIVTSASYSLTSPHTPKTAQQASFTCKTALTTGLPNVQADPGQVQQILLNLLINAFDAMPQGGIVTVASAMAPDPGFVAITITDSGPGIGAEIKENIFMPFFSTKKKGTGLGLAICKTLARKNRGDLTLNDPIAGGGASFSLFLPIANEQGALP